MDIIQQKLILLMGSGAAIILLFKLKLKVAGLEKTVLNRLRIGFGLLMIASFAGIILKIGSSLGSFSKLAPVNFLETTLGYVAGWTMVISGLMKWASGYFDNKGKPLTTINLRTLSDRASSSLIKGHRPNQLLDSVMDDLKEILVCHAVSLHRVDDDHELWLAFEHGLTPRSKNLIGNRIDDGHMIKTALKSKRAVTSDKDLVMRDGSRLQSLEGPLISALSVPAGFENEILGVLTLYRAEKKSFTDEDVKLTSVVCEALGIVMQNDIAEKKNNLISRYREMLILATRPFENGEPLVSALIKSAKLIYGYIPFKRIALYINGDGKPQETDFNLSTGGVVSVKRGYFQKKEHPELFADPVGPKQTGSGFDKAKAKGDKGKFVFPVAGLKNQAASLVIELSHLAPKTSNLALLGTALGQKIGDRLKNEQAERISEISKQWLGAMQYYQLKSISSNNVSSLLEEIASLVVDLTPVAFCRIIFADSRHEYFKTVAMAQARELKWPARNPYSKIRLSSRALHRKALRDIDPVFYECGGHGRTLSSDEQSTLVPLDTRNGLIMPLQMGERNVGLLVVGDARNIGRSTFHSDAILFLNSVAALISTILTRNKEIRDQGGNKEGRRILNLRQKDSRMQASSKSRPTNFRTQVNGPLAGILASCEYLQSRGLSGNIDVDRFIGIIQRNATKIHEIAAGTEKAQLVQVK